MSKYMIVLILSGIGPLVLSFYHPFEFYKNLKALILTIVTIVFVFCVWDIFAVFRGHWYFEEDSIGTIKIFNLPLEEVLFFVVIPFCCIFTWELIKFFKNRGK